MPLRRLIITIAAFFFCLAVTAFAADGVRFSACDHFLLPHLMELLGAVLGALGGWLISRLVKLIGVTDTAKRLEVEGHLRQALHFAAERRSAVRAGAGRSYTG